MAYLAPILAILAACAPAVHAYKVLFVPVPAGSHMVLLSSVAEAWVKAGHTAHIVKHHSVPIPSQFKTSNIKYVTYGKKDELHFTLEKNFTEFVGKMSQKSFLEITRMMSSFFPRLCSELLTNEDVYNRLESEKYDFILLDNMPAMDCLHAIPHRLRVPYGTVGVIQPLDITHSLQIHYLGATLPLFYTKEPSFLVRLGQFLALHAMDIGMYFAMDRAMIVDYIKDRPLDNLADLKRNSKIWLIDMEPLIDAPKHSAPNVIYVGGLSATPVQPLPTDLAKFADSAKTGLIVVSFGGSLTTDFPEEMLKRLMDGLSSVPYKVIIRLKTKPKFKIGSNIMITSWLPQNDLLGHRNTVLFVTHCGMSSINEAVHNGVPMLGFPNQVEQRYNAIRFCDKNYGIMMDRNTFTPQELKAAIERMITQPMYKNAIKKASNIIKGRRFTPQQEAVYWIDHVIKYGGDHLVPFTSQLSWFQVMMYDILLFLIAVAVIFLFIIIKCCACVGRLCCRKGGKQKTN